MASEGVCPPPSHPEEPRRIVAALLVVYLAYVALFAWTPFTLSVGASDSIGALFHDKFEWRSSFSRATAWDVWSNILFFFPCGFLVALLPSLSRTPGWVKTVIAGLIAMLVSGVIEIVQVLLPRVPSVADITWNAVGGFIGGLFGIFAEGWLLQSLQSWLRGVQIRTVFLVILSGYVVALPMAFGIPVPVPRDFRTWDPTYHLLLGNEGTMNRAWRGEFHLVAVYDRPLTPEEVSQNFSAGPSPSLPQHRVRDGLVLLYDFSEGGGDLVHDRAPAGGQVDLRIRDLGRVRWLHPNGLVLRDATVVASEKPPLILTGWQVAARDTVSVEAWITPADLSQGSAGPARIVSYSMDTGHLNFTLGQERGDVVFRLRTPASGVDGTRRTLRTNDQPVQLALEHLLVTYQSGRETLYVNGIMHSTALLRSQDTLVDLAVGRIGEQFKWIVYSIMIFPLGILSYTFCARKKAFSAKVVVFFAVTLAGVISIAGFSLLIAQAEIEPFFFVVAVGTLLVSVLTARQFFPKT